jgi:hypothetical protein
MTSPADIFAASPVVIEKLVIVTDVVVLAVCCKNNPAPFVTSLAKHNHPLGAVGNVSVPEAAPPLPTVTEKQLGVAPVILGAVPNPLAITGCAANVPNPTVLGVLVNATWLVMIDLPLV